MTDMIGRGMLWLQGQRETHMSIDVAYCAGAQAVDVQASRGRRTYEVMTLAGILEAIESVDWLITGATLLLDGLRVEPARGHRIKEPCGDGTVRVYEVLDLGGKAGCFTYSDADTLRIHSKFVRVEDEL